MDEPRIETRISLVLYGGVSLAVYMSGACKELLSVVRAGACWIPDEELTPVEREYRRICQSGGSDKQPRRVVVDVLSGSSAGGLNALFLAKALAHGGNLDGLRNVWYQQADLLDLMTNSTNRSSEPPAALLDGRRFHKILHDALSELSSQADDPDQNRLVDTVDCYVTTTDLRGVAETVRLDSQGTMEIQELRRRAVFHFVDRRPSSNRPRETQLDQSHDAVLAFAGRATSAHPAALYPANWNDVEQGQEERTNRDHDLKQFLSPRLHPEEGYLDLEDRWYSDGGAMDNKPFKYALAPVGDRRAEIPVDRKVLFVEPDPVAELGNWEDTDPPSLWARTAGTYGLARAEDIRDDIGELAANNDAVARLNSALGGLFDRSDDEIRAALIARLAKDHADAAGLGDRQLVKAVLQTGYRRVGTGTQAQGGPVGGGVVGGGVVGGGVVGGGVVEGGVVETWVNQPREEFGAARGWGAVALEDYRWRTVISQLVQTALTVGETPADSALVARLAGPVQERIERWIKYRNGPVPNIQRLGLVLLDVEYRLRRFSLIEHLLSAEQRSIVRNPAPTAADVARFAQCMKLRKTINSFYFDLHDYVGRQRSLDLIGGHRRPSDEELLAYLDSDDFDRRIEETVEELSYPLRRASDDGRKAILTAGLDHSLLLRAADAWVNYSDYDQLILPLGDVAASKFETVDAVRVSPLDARTLVDERCPGMRRRKLGGNALAHFGGFLDENWRLNDITWGRLDTAEVVVTRILNGTPDDVRRVNEALLEELAAEARTVSTGAAGAPDAGYHSAGSHSAGSRSAGSRDAGALDALLAVNRNQRSTLHRRAAAELEALRSGRGTEAATAAAFRTLLEGPLATSANSAGDDGEDGEDRTLWDVDLSATARRSKTKSVALNRSAVLAGKALAFSEPRKRSRVVVGWLLSGALRLTLPRTGREKLVRHGLPVALALVAIPLLAVAANRDVVAAACAGSSLVAFGGSLYARARAFGTLNLPRLWHNGGRALCVASVALFIASIRFGRGPAGLAVLGLLLLLAAASMWWSFGNLELLIRRAGHPDPASTGRSDPAPSGHSHPASTGRSDPAPSGRDRKRRMGRVAELRRNRRGRVAEAGQTVDADRDRDRGRPARQQPPVTPGTVDESSVRPPDQLVAD